MAYVEKGDILLFIKSWKVKDFLNIKLLHEDIICIFTLSDLDDISEYFSCVCLNTLYYNKPYNIRGQICLLFIS